MRGPEIGFKLVLAQRRRRADGNPLRAGKIGRGPYAFELKEKSKAHLRTFEPDFPVILIEQGEDLATDLRDRIVPPLPNQSGRRQAEDEALESCPRVKAHLAISTPVGSGQDTPVPCRPQ